MKQDRNGVRTAQDLERKYKLAGMRKAVEQSEQGITKLNREMEDFIEKVTEELGNVSDGGITTYYRSGAPTLQNFPAVEWTEYNVHVGDMYYDKDTGYAYRFNETNGGYAWEKIQDQDTIEALAIANAASDTADGKRRVFTDIPVPPYDNGDLWIYEEELYVCQISKAKEEAYVEGDFIIATKYTDDTVATQTANELTVVKGQVTTIIEDNNELKIEFTETVTQVNSLTNEVANEIDERKALIRLGHENGLPVVELGSTESPVRTKYRNDGMYIEENGNVTSYFKNGKAFNFDMEVLNSLKIGNYAWIPRENGNLSLVYVGSE